MLESWTVVLIRYLLNTPVKPPRNLSCFGSKVLQSFCCFSVKQPEIHRRTNGIGDLCKGTQSCVQKTPKLPWALFG